MTVSIPSAGGVPGASGPPDWLSGGAGQDFRLDDVRWRGATKVDFAAGAAHGIFFRAIHAASGQEFIYITLRAGFVPEMNTSRDFIYLGLQRHGTTDAIVIRIQAHDSSFSNAGPPSANPPVHPFTIQVNQSTGGGSFSGNIVGNPNWIDANARVWLQDNTNISDPNFRWAVQIRIPVSAAGGILNTNGPQLSTDFDMWYLIRGSVMGMATILGEYRIDGNNTTAFDLTNGNYPLPSGIWDEFQLTSGPASFGGVTILGNGQNDVVVQNGLGTGTTIQNGAVNTFIARPRNYRAPGNDIAAGDIAATFRIANWGSVATAAPWDFVDPAITTPVASTAVIPTLAAAANPPATSPIAQPVTMNLPAGKSTHQCVLCTLSSTGPVMMFLQDSVFRNMNYDHASTLEREAEINTEGIPKDDAPDPRDVYIAIEKVGMEQNTPGADEGIFLINRMTRAMRRGGPLADKLKRVLEILRNIGQETKDQKQRLDILVTVLSDAGLTDDELDQVFPTFRVHVYHDTGERLKENGEEKPVLRAQTSFGLYMYHEGPVEGWQTSIQGATRISGNVYQMPVPKDGSGKIKVIVQAVDKGQDRIPEDPIREPKGAGETGPGPEDRKGCLLALWKLLGLK
ncbi:MAG TPA: hypothetical protein VE980_20575 [Pyrinomonadaceae bacterium]|nr:hypothetical protein [Pyrinomonadaceae bacterium]